MTSSQLNRSGDVRGNYPQDVNEELAFLCGQLLVLFLHTTNSSPRVLVGRDGRTHSHSLYQSVIEGIRQIGGVPLPVGLTTTDALTWGTATEYLHAAAGVMVTASHNGDPRDHGIKFFQRRGNGVRTIRPVRDLKPLLNGGLLPAFQAAAANRPSPNTAGPVTEDLCRAFVQHACSFAANVAEFQDRIVLDPGNGVACLLADRLPAEVPRAAIDCIGRPIDGSFPARGPDPTAPGALASLQQRVLDSGAAFGAAFDGDADRIVFVLEDGRVVSSQTAMSLLADVMLGLESTLCTGRHVIFASPSSWQLIDILRKHKAVPVIARVGQENIKEAISTLDAMAGFEPSGHFNFGESFGQDSGLIAMMHVWQAIHQGETRLSTLVDQLPPWRQTGDINIQVKHLDLRTKSDAVMDELARCYRTTSNRCYVSRLDGLSVYYPFSPTIATEAELFPPLKGAPTSLAVRGVHPSYRPDWWFNVRCSRNESLIRLNVECRPTEAISTLVNELVERIQAACRRVEPASEVALVEGDQGWRLRVSPDLE